MALAFAVVGGLLVFVIAAVVVGRETGRLARQAPRPVFDVDEAVVWIADHLPADALTSSGWAWALKPARSRCWATWAPRQRSSASAVRAAVEMPWP